MKDLSGDSSVPRNLLYVVLILVIGLMGAVVATNFPQLVGLRSSAATPLATPVIATAQSPTAAVEGAESEQESQAMSPVTPTIALATPWGVLGLDGSSGTEAITAEATPMPNLPPVSLLGPPSESQFRLTDPVTFYWDWPESLVDGQRFALYVGSGAGEVLVGSAEAENLGSIQQLGAALGSVIDEPGPYRWWVVVEDDATGTVLAQSEHRPLVLLAGVTR